MTPDEAPRLLTDSQYAAGSAPAVEVLEAESKAFPLDQYWSHAWPRVVLVLIILICAGIRFHLRNTPLDRDEGEYAYAGQLLLQGVPPYKLAYNMKLPGTYAGYAVILAIFGQTPAGIHLGVLIVNAATILLIYLLTVRLFDQLAGLAAAATYGLLSVGAGVLGFVGHATHFVVLPAVAGILLLLKGMESRRVGLLFWSGVLLGAFVMKQPGIFFACFGGAYLLACEWKKKANFLEVGRQLTIFSLGVVAPFALTCLLMLKAGVFSKFWFWTFSYAEQYATINPASTGLHTFRKMLHVVMDRSQALWAFAGLGMIALLWNRKARAHAGFLAGFLFFSSLSICPGLYFRRHYFILLLPVVAVLAGLGLSSAYELLSQPERKRWLRWIPVFVFLFALQYCMRRQRKFLFQLDPVALSNAVYPTDPFALAPEIAAYLRQHTGKTEKIAVLGSEPEIFFYSHRRSATGYIYVYSLMEEQAYALAMQKEAIGEIEAARPKYVVYVYASYSWALQPHSQLLFLSWAQRYVRQGYELAGVADVKSGICLWNDEVRSYELESPWTVYVYRRREIEPASDETQHQPPGANTTGNLHELPRFW